MYIWDYATVLQKYITNGHHIPCEIVVMTTHVVEYGSLWKKTQNVYELLLLNMPPDLIFGANFQKK